MSHTIEPAVIRQSLLAGNQFTGDPPALGAEVDGLIFDYPDRSAGGFFRHSTRRFFRLRRFVADFKDATTWSVRIRHKDTGNTETIVAEGQSQVLTFQVTGGTDGTYTITIDGTAYAHPASGETADQIAAALFALLDAGESNVNTVITVVTDTITIVAVTDKVFSSSSTGDPITETEVQASDGLDSVVRLELDIELIPDEAVVVFTTGATQAMFAETTAFVVGTALQGSTGG